MTGKVTKSVATSPLRTVHGTSRRQQYSASTRRALVDVATELFSRHGYAGTSLDEIVAGARVTKGALYHHFSGKQALFESVFDEVEERSAREIHRAVRGHLDPWEKALGGLRAFLAVLQQPDYRRIVISDGPAVLGYERCREQEERTTFGIVQEIVSSVLSGYRLQPSMVETFSRVFFGAMSASGASVSSAEDPARAGAEVEAAIAYILAGLRQMAESGADPPGPSLGDLLEDAVDVVDVVDVGDPDAGTDED
ncbi:MAG: TetR/AcrR family transcriptional regulator [Nocardioidaceae bacterium]